MAKTKAKAGLQIEVVPIDSIYEDPANARRHGEKNLAAIEGSLRQFGQVEPLVVQASTGKVVGGNGRLATMKQLGWAECQIIRLDLSDIQATSLAIALNRAAELAEWDFEALSKQVSALLAENIDLSTLGWQEHELEPMLQADWTPPEIGPLDFSPDGSGGSDESSQPLIVNGDQRLSILKAVAVWRERTGDYGSTDGSIVEAICSAWAQENSRGITPAIP